MHQGESTTKTKGQKKKGKQIKTAHYVKTSKRTREVIADASKLTRRMVPFIYPHTFVRRVILLQIHTIHNTYVAIS